MARSRREGRRAHRNFLRAPVRDRRRRGQTVRARGHGAQRKKLAQSLAVVVAALDDPDSLLPAVSALGKRHTHYGVEHHHFDSVGEALLTALGTTLGAAYTQEIHDAWAEAYALVAAVMKRALVRAEAVHGGARRSPAPTSEKPEHADMQ